MQDKPLKKIMSRNELVMFGEGTRVTENRIWLVVKEVLNTQRNLSEKLKVPVIKVTQWMSYLKVLRC